jgi:SAM-dependent methyltransferase
MSAASESEESTVPAEYLEIEVRGERVPLGFVEEGSRVCLAATSRSAQWPTEVLRTGTARLRQAGRRWDGSATLVTDSAERERWLRLFRLRYGEERFQRWYAHAARLVVIDPNAPDRLEATAPYDRWLESEFDLIAGEYDRHIFGNRINRLLRDRSLELLRSVFRGAPRLLEVGCGSGTETLPLLQEGHEVVCVDVSQQMLDVVRGKARAAGVSERLTTVHGRARDVGTLAGEWTSGFDGGYSTYGALNCEEDLSGLPGALYGLLRPGSAFLAGVYNRWCTFELFGYGITGSWRRAVGRWGRPIRVGSSRFCIDVFAASPPEFERLFRPWFVRERVEAVPVFLPPSDLVRYVGPFAARFDRLARWDRAMGRRWPFWALGDHFLMVLRRTPGRTPLLVPAGPPDRAPADRGGAG